MKKLTLLLMTLAAIFVFAGCAKSPKGAALNWGRAISSGNLEVANKFSTPESTENNAFLIKHASRFSYDMFAKKVNNAKVEINGDSAKLTVEGEKEPFPLKKIDGKWKVDASEL